MLLFVYVLMLLLLLVLLLFFLTQMMLFCRHLNGASNGVKMLNHNVRGSGDLLNRTLLAPLAPLRVCPWNVLTYDSVLSIPLVIPAVNARAPPEGLLERRAERERRERYIRDLCCEFLKQSLLFIHTYISVL